MRITVFTCHLFLATLCLVPGTLFAKPEVIEIKSAARKAEEAKAAALAQSIDLTKVEDPDTRLALEAILGMIEMKKQRGSNR